MLEISTLFLTVTIDSIESRQGNISVKGSFSSLMRSGYFQAQVDSELNVISFNFTK